MAHKHRQAEDRKDVLLAQVPQCLSGARVKEELYGATEYARAQSQDEGVYCLHGHQITKTQGRAAAVDPEGVGS